MSRNSLARPCRQTGWRRGELSPPGLDDDQDHAERGDVGPPRALVAAPEAPDRASPALNHRRFLEAVLWLARTGAPWRDLPAELMNWRTAWRRLQRWTAAGVWERVIDALRAMAPEAGWEAHMLDSTVIRAHAHAAGARKATGQQALGRSRGGFSTKLHLRGDARGRPVAFHLTAGPTPRPDRRRPVVRAGRPAHRQARPAALEAGGGDRRQGVLGRVAARRAPPEGDHARHPEPVRPARAPRLRPRDLPAAQPGRAARRQAEAVPPRGDPLREARPALPRLHPDRLRRPLVARVWRHGLVRAVLPEVLRRAQQEVDPVVGLVVG